MCRGVCRNGAPHGCVLTILIITDKIRFTSLRSLPRSQQAGKLLR